MSVNAQQVNVLLALVDLGLKTVQRVRAIRGTPRDGEITAEEVRGILVQDVDDLIEQGRRQARGED